MNSIAYICVQKIKNQIMTKSMHQFKLVNSTYELPAAREVLLSLINDKINSLNMQIFSNYERFGDNSDHLRKRVKELKEVKIKLMDYLLDLNESECRVKISAPVMLEIETKTPVEGKTLEHVL